MSRPPSKMQRIDEIKKRMANRHYMLTLTPCWMVRTQKFLNNVQDKDIMLIRAIRLGLIK